MTIAPPRTLASFIDQVGGRAACLALSRDPNAKVTVLLFPPGAARPAYVAKVPTTDVAARSVEREAAQLAEVGTRPLGPVGRLLRWASRQPRSRWPPRWRPSPGSRWPWSPAPAT